MKIIYILVAVATLAVLLRWFFLNQEPPVSISPESDDAVMCTADATRCWDGSYVGRTGPTCEFVCPPPPVVPADITLHIAEKADLIKLNSPIPFGVVESGEILTGLARGPWYFEASFPVILTNWDGLIIAETYATAEGEWMTEDFVPFTATLEFTSPYNPGDPDFMKRGSLILQKDNPSGLPEHDNALEIPISFAP